MNSRSSCLKLLEYHPQLPTLFFSKEDWERAFQIQVLLLLIFFPQRILSAHPTQLTIDSLQGKNTFLLNTYGLSLTSSPLQHSVATIYISSDITNYLGMVYVHSWRYPYHRLHTDTAPQTRELGWNVWWGARSFRCVVMVVRSTTKMQASAAVCWNCCWPWCHQHSARAAALLLGTATTHGCGHALWNPSPVITSSNSHANPVRNCYFVPVGDKERALGKWRQFANVTWLLRGGPRAPPTLLT